MAYSIRNLLNLNDDASAGSSNNSGSAANAVPPASRAVAPAAARVPSGSGAAGRAGGRSVRRILHNPQSDTFASGVEVQEEMVGEQGDSLVREADSEQQSKSQS